MKEFMNIKGEFLDEYFSEENLNLRTQYRIIYESNILPKEIELDKDLYKFTKDEIKELTGIKAKSPNAKYKNTTEEFVFEYLKWRKEREKELKRIQKEARLQEIKKAKNKLKVEKENRMEKYLKQKEVFMYEYFLETDVKDVTKDTYMDIFKNYICPLEGFKEKDLKDFNENDIRELFESIPTISKNTIRIIYSVIKFYMLWVDSKGLNINNHNPLDTLDVDDLYLINIKAITKEFPTLETVYELCEKYIQEGGNYQDCLIILLARYGIEGRNLKELRYLKWEDINLNTKDIRVVDEETGEIIKTVPFDNRLIKWIESAKECNIYNYSTTQNRERYFYDNGYVIKSTIEDDIVEKKSNIYRRVKKFKEFTGYHNLAFRNLVTAREFDKLDEIAEESKLTTEDFKRVHSIYYPNSCESTYFFVKEKYEVCRNIEIPVIRRLR